MKRSSGDKLIHYRFIPRMTHNAGDAQVVGTDLPPVQLTEKDIPGAALEEPLEGHTVPALRWWLLCHGIQAPIERLAMRSAAWSHTAWHTMSFCSSH